MFVHHEPGTIDFFKIFQKISQEKSQGNNRLFSNSSLSTSISEELSPKQNHLNLKCHHYFLEHHETLSSTPMKTFQRLNFTPKGYKNPLLKIDLVTLLDYLETNKGSRYYQNLLEFSTDFETRLILKKIEPCFAKMMCSKYANYFMQTLFMKLDLSQRICILNYIKPLFIEICMNSFGTYSIQGFIDAFSSEEEFVLLEFYIKKDILKLICNENSHHIIQKIIIEFPEQKRKYINDCFIQNFVKICISQYGYLCGLKFIKHTKSQKIKQYLSQIICIPKNLVSLIKAKFGTVVVITAIKEFGINCFMPLLKELEKTENLVLFATLNQNSVNFLESYFQYLSYFNKIFFLNFLYSKLNPKSGFVQNLFGNDFGERFLLRVLFISNQKIIKYFIQTYHKIPKGLEMYKSFLESKD